MGRGFFALANHRAVFSVFRPKLASLVRLQLRHSDPKSSSVSSSNSSNKQQKAAHRLN
ncbi:hypothetical protein M752DRAFT_275475 [Aspergillus phoenicis ATCC 13157]|uniref:Uncharacterized protein n=1 Tax=Aspergillus phoenicis ATCC 13157 TaxID=1353007 RepID=A0A370PM05_ASPPH|nr:hypothetical protein M752DRAFT_275475 [Aspergillus phoenicis ATCC 13157]